MIKKNLIVPIQYQFDNVVFVNLLAFLRRKVFPSHCQEEISWPEPRMAQGRVEPTSFPYLNVLTLRRTAYKVHVGVLLSAHAIMFTPNSHFSYSKALLWYFSYLK